MKLTDNPTEMTTAVTDLCLALVAAAGVCYLRWIRPADLWKLNAWSAAFGMIALSGAFGFIFHGILLPGALHARLWQAINVSLGFAVSLFVVCVVYDFRGLTIARPMLPIMLGAALVFLVVTRIYPQAFFVFIVYEALALIFALGVYVWLAFFEHSPGALAMAGGILVSLIAGGLQVNKRIGLRLIWSFDHNGVFHLVQLVGLVFLLAGLRISLGS